MVPLPRDTHFDATFALLRDPYEFISKRCQWYESDAFQTRLMLRRTICMKGSSWAKVFYDPERFERRSAAPRWLTKTLFGQGGIQGLDDEEHRHRKQMFMSLMSDERIAQLVRLTSECWQSSLERWRKQKQVVLYEEFQEILCRSVCAWAGVPLPENDVQQRTSQLSSLFDFSFPFSPPYWRARVNRKRTNHWIKQHIQAVRSGKLKPAEETASHVIAWHRQLKGELLDSHVAAVELINVLRPTVAVSVFLTFVAHALHENPGYSERLRSNESGFVDWFVQEVRRYYPFFPFVTAVVRRDFEKEDVSFKAGTSVLLDLYGTNHDERIWQQPGNFNPERFREWTGSPYNFIPQGGGDHFHNHRCPGEWIAIELMKMAVRRLVEMNYEVPRQDLTIDRTRLPALPRSRCVIEVR